jgi:hypothetical protein
MQSDKYLLKTVVRNLQLIVLNLDKNKLGFLSEFIPSSNKLD